MLRNLLVVDKESLLEEVAMLKNDGYRFSALTCESLGESLELTYHFDFNYELKNIRVIVPIGEAAYSISNIYPSAFLIENETQDLFGLKFLNLTIDYKGKLYLTDDSPKAPML